MVNYICGQISPDSSEKNLFFSSSTSFENTDIQCFMPHDQSFKPHFFFALFANALAFFRKQQRLPNDIQKCFSSFFRSEAVFDILSISIGVCPVAQRK